jgi:hypothetical protein
MRAGVSPAAVSASAILLADAASAPASSSNSMTVAVSDESSSTLAARRHGSGHAVARGQPVAGLAPASGNGQEALRGGCRGGRTLPPTTPLPPQEHPMTKSSAGRRLAVAATIVAASIGAAAPAQAAKYECEGGVERLEQEFREIEEKRGYDAATKWWYKVWPKYHERCIAP